MTFTKASNGVVEVQLKALTPEISSLVFRDPSKAVSMCFGIEVTPDYPRAVDLIERAQPDLTWDNYKFLVRDIVRLGVPVTTFVDGREVPVTDTPDEPKRSGLKGLFGRRRKQPINPERYTSDTGR